MKKVTLFSAIFLCIDCLICISSSIINAFQWWGKGNDMMREHIEFFRWFYIVSDWIRALAFFSIALFFIKLYNKQK